MIAIYRAMKNAKYNNDLPYVVLKPEHNTLLYENDKLFVFSNPFILAKALESIEAVIYASSDAVHDFK